MDQEREIYVPSEGPPPGGSLSPEIYAIMGEENILRMLEDFYKELEHSPIRHLFPNDMIEASRKSGEFFVFLLGGPPLYQQKYGSPMMRRRHLKFIIDEKARQIWLQCFKKTLLNADLKYKFPMEHMGNFVTFLEKFSAWMVNTK